MVPPITVIDETSNDDDESVIILNLNLEITTDDYDTDKSKNDALAEAAAAGRASVEKATAEAERAVATAKAAAERASASERAAAAKAAAEIAAMKAAAEIAATERAAAERAAAAEIAAMKAAAKIAAAEIAAMKAAAERAATERAAAERDAAAEAKRHKINIHAAGRIYPKVAPHLSLTVRDGRVILAKSSDRDLNQQWYRFEKYSTHITDVEGGRSIIFENNGTGLTLQRAIRNDSPVRLIKHRFNEIDRSVLWTRGNHVGSGPDAAFTLRSVDDIRLELVIHNRNIQEGEKIISYKFPDANEHLYWKFTHWR